MDRQESSYAKVDIMRKFSSENAEALKFLTSKQFFDVWNNFDQDGNGYIEGRELDKFLQEFVASIRDDRDTLDERLLLELKKAFMDAYDNNHDGRIDIRELAQLLPLEDSFKLLFKFENQVDSSVEFMRIWGKYDTDASGYIDSDELKDFLRDLITVNQMKLANSEANGQQVKFNKPPPTCSVDETKLDEYTEILLKIFDSNKDGKLQLNEMTKLLLVRENFLEYSGIFRESDKKLDKRDIEKIFMSYDRDANGVIENDELKGFIKDLMDFLGKTPDTRDIEDFERLVLDGCDTNGDGKINKKELTTVLLALAKFAAEEEKQTSNN